MAESIIIHFNLSNRSEIIDCLNRNFDRHKESCWYHPSEDYLVMIVPYEHYEVEYEDEEKKVIREKLMAEPNASFEFEIRRSKSDEACDLIEKFIRRKLSDFDFVVDDMNHVYSKEELLEVSNFLDIYRYKK